MDSLDPDKIRDMCILLCKNKKINPETIPTTKEDLIIFYEANTKIVNYNNMIVSQLKNECKKYGLKVSGKKQDLIDRLNEYHGTSTKEKGDTKLSSGILYLLAKKDLERICKQLHIQHTGKKDELVTRIEQCEKEEKDMLLKNTAVPVKKRKMKKDQIDKYHNRVKELVKKLNKTYKKKECRLIPKKLKVKYNHEINHYYDDNTGFVFDSMEKKVISTYKNGKMQSLCDDDIALCKELHISWVTPEIILDDDDMKAGDKKEKSEEDIKDEDVDEDEEEDDGGDDGGDDDSNEIEEDIEMD